MINDLSFLLAGLKRGFLEDLKGMLESALLDLVQGRNQLKSNKLKQLRKVLWIDLDIIFEILPEDLVHAFLMLVRRHK